MENVAHKRHVKHTFTVMQPSIPILTLVNFVDAEDITNEKVRTLDLPLRIIRVTSKLDFQKLSIETYEPNGDIMLTRRTDPKNKCKPHFQKNCTYYH